MKQSHRNPYQNIEYISLVGLITALHKTYFETISFPPYLAASCSAASSSFQCRCWDVKEHEQDGDNEPGEKLFPPLMATTGDHPLLLRCAQHPKRAAFMRLACLAARSCSSSLQHGWHRPPKERGAKLVIQSKSFSQYKSNGSETIAQQNAWE